MNEQWARDLAMGGEGPLRPSEQILFIDDDRITA